jgi:hypothetical protein
VVISLTLISFTKQLSLINFASIASLINIYAGALILNALYIQSIRSDVGIYIGLNYFTYFSQLLDSFIFFIIYFYFVYSSYILANSFNFN